MLVELGTADGSSSSWRRGEGNSAADWGVEGADALEASVIIISKELSSLVVDILLCQVKTLVFFLVLIDLRNYRLHRRAISDGATSDGRRRTAAWRGC